MSGRSTGIMNDLNIDDYGFKMGDAAVAALLKSYLNKMTKDGALDALDSIVSIGIRNLPVPFNRSIRIRATDIPKDTWVTINGPALAQMIEAAKTAAVIESENWRASADQPILSKSVQYIREEFIPGLNGEHYVSAMPVEMAEFITDCYLAVR